ncbi:MAG: TRAP transporter substrate-binding protein DctP [Candidatus Bathyarchaeia archaeon]
MKVRVLTTFFAVFILIGVIVSPCRPQQKVVIRFSHGLPESHSVAIQYKEWANLIYERSKGHVKIELYPAAQLYKDQDAVKAVQMGTIEAGAFYAFNLDKIIREYRIFTVPFTFYTLEDASAILNSDIRTMLEKKAESQSIKVLAFIPYGPPEAEGLLAKTLLRTPSDCRGKMFRAIDETVANLIKLWGGGAVFLSGAELYMALQRGTIHGTVANLSQLVERKLYEVAPFHTVLPYAFVPALVTVNASFFGKLPQEAQEIIVKTSKEIENKAFQVTTRKAYEDNLKFLRDRGLPLPYKPTKEEMALWTKGVDSIRESAIKDIPDGIALLKRIDQMVGKRK